MAIQANGRIVAAGFGWDASPTPHQYVAIARYLTNGTLDDTWNGGGIVLTDADGLLGGSQRKSSATAVAVQSDGMVVVTGWAHGSGLSQLVVVRYDSAGVLDPAFSGDGLVAHNIETTAAGTSLALAFRRENPRGRGHPNGDCVEVRPGPAPDQYVAMRVFFFFCCSSFSYMYCSL